MHSSLAWPWNSSAARALLSIPGHFCPHRPGISQAALMGGFSLIGPVRASYAAGKGAETWGALASLTAARLKDAVY